MDTLKLRTAKIALSENKKDPTVVGEVTKITVVIDIVSTLPMLTMTDALIENSLMAEVATPSDPAALDTDNTLFDPVYGAPFLPDGVTANPNVDEVRFTYITSGRSELTNNLVRLYHDAMFDDIIIVPELSYIDNTLDNTQYELRGYRVGGGCDVNGVDNDLIVPDGNTFKLPLTKQNIANISKHVKMHGIARDSANSYYYKSLDNGDKIVNRKLTTVAMIKLGSTGDLFVNADLRLPMYTINQVTPDRYALKFLGNIKPNSIYIPLNF